MNKTGTHKKETCPHCECHKEHQIINGGSGYYILLVKHLIFFSGLESELLFHLLGRIEVWIIIWRFETQPRLTQPICVWNWILLCVKGLHLLWDLPSKEEPGLPPDWTWVLEWRTRWREKEVKVPGLGVLSQRIFEESREFCWSQKQDVK